MALTDLSATLKGIFNYKVERDPSGKSNDRLTTDTETLNTSYSQTFTFGTGAENCNQLVSDKRTLAGSASDNLNVSGGAHSSPVSLKNSFDETATFTKLRGFAVHNNSATNTISIGGDSTDNLTALFGDNSDKIRIPPGWTIIMFGPSSAGIAVATNEIFQVNNEGGSSTEYEVAIAGVG